MTSFKRRGDDEIVGVDCHNATEAEVEAAALDADCSDNMGSEDDTQTTAQPRRDRYHEREKAENPVSLPQS